ncbi:MAG: AraC family transcriptional regulator [Mucilaginibacter sp.]
MAIDQYPRDYLYKRVVQAKLYIDANYARKIEVAGISDEAYFSKFHFIRLFKQIYGKTPHQYLTFVRVENAMQLLRANQPIADVCQAVGFETLSAFSSVFKRRVGLTPSAFKAQQMQQQIQILKAPLNFVPGCVVYQHGFGEK